MTSTGTGISHSEYNRNSSQQVHFLQIWAQPNQSRLPPQYYTRNFSRSQKLDKLIQVVAPLSSPSVTDSREGTGPVPVHADLEMWASILSSKKKVQHELGGETKRAYLHNIMKSGYRGPGQEAGDKFEDGGARLRVNGGLVLEEGDGAFVTVTATGGEGKREIEVENVGEREAEWLLFEMRD